VRSRFALSYLGNRLIFKLENLEGGENYEAMSQNKKGRLCSAKGSEN